jgi:hypothetical protein
MPGVRLYPRQVEIRAAAQRWAGVSLLRFNADGLVVEERDFWSQG